eukprot:TRINITY_DN2974_c0_g1_i2.p1 TRINITY_DN2974_c0_g1~~TRINITY_DN2974_c0_g1_i2.p1  ORF type:complete len:326 (-),score=30.54 TRINITY_DN2974_c0_g1_i2:84-962(-)
MGVFLFTYPFLRGIWQYQMDDHDKEFSVSYAGDVIDLNNPRANPEDIDGKEGSAFQNQIYQLMRVSFLIRIGEYAICTLACVFFLADISAKLFFFSLEGSIIAALCIIFFCGLHILTETRHTIIYNLHFRFCIRVTAIMAFIYVMGWLASKTHMPTINLLMQLLLWANAVPLIYFFLRQPRFLNQMALMTPLVLIVLVYTILCELTDSLSVGWSLLLGAIAISYFYSQIYEMQRLIDVYHGDVEALRRFRIGFLHVYVEFLEDLRQHNAKKISLFDPTVEANNTNYEVSKAN